MPYEATVNGGILGSCTIKGATTMSSAGSDLIGGGLGRAYDPAAKTFAVAGTSDAPALHGNLCALAGDFLDPSRGLGWYLDGSLTVDAPTAAPPARAAVTGWTRDQRATGGHQRRTDGEGLRAMGDEAHREGLVAPVRTPDDPVRQVIIRTTGTAKKLFVRVTLRAPSIDGYSAFRTTRLWAVR
ncbi:MAG: hypothetical protein IPG68_01705 [Micrococcales bacterium]|nr:hypothetical protein [Micrococcales bacterium]